MSQPILSHRSAQFVADLARVQARLCALVNAPHVEFLFGSGTLGNEAVAGQLSLLPSRGLMLVNGEFGRRLRDDARRWRLDFSTLEIPWGDVFDLAAVAAALDADPAIGWLWCVHSETSSGVLNDVPGLIDICAARGVKLCLDCISSLGVVPLDLRQVYLASATSGKALGAVTGLAMVFSNYAPEVQPDRLPSYLDLGYYRQAQGVPFTIDTNLVYALDRALDHFEARGADATAQTAASLRAQLRARGLTLVAPEHAASPAVTTIALPAHVSSLAVGDALAQQGFLLSYRSKYLIARNWLQICLMGDYRTDTLPDLVAALLHWTTHAASSPVTA
jgi:aspartate aminotransferase-like enzyme